MILADFWKSFYKLQIDAFKKKRAAQPDLRSYATRCIHDYSIFPENRKGSFAQIGQKKIDESGEKAYDISKI